MKALQSWTVSLSSSSSVVHLVITAVGQQRCLALLLLVLNEEEYVAQRESHLALATSEQVVVRVEARWQGVSQAGVQRMGT